MKILTPSHSKEIRQNDLNFLILNYLRETNMNHTAFCFKHEAQITRKAKLKEGKLFSLVKKGFILENLEKESQQVLTKLDKQVRDFAASNRDQRHSMSRQEEETLKRELSLKQYISTKISSELNKMMKDPYLI